MPDITPNTVVNHPQIFSLHGTADRVCSLISASPIERRDPLGAFVSELTPNNAQKIWGQFPIPGHAPTPLPGDGVDAQASTLEELVREQMASERIKALQVQRNRSLSQEATER